MHSLPFISHHLFVEAIGNEGHAQERPIRHLRLSGGAAAPAPPIAWEAMDSRRPISVGQTRPLQTSLTRARG